VIAYLAELVIFVLIGSDIVIAIDLLVYSPGGVITGLMADELCNLLITSKF